MFRAVVAAAVALSAAPAFAQSPYVSAAAGMDVSRFGGVDRAGFNALQPDGEAIAVSIRAGTRIGQSWGVELGFTRPSEVEKEATFSSPIPLPRLTLSSQPMAGGMPMPILPFETRSRLERRDTTLDTVAWIAQPVSSRVDLVYLGGVAFNRTVEETSFEITTRVAILPPIVIPNSVRTTTYGVAPVVGFEGRIALTDHLRLVPGVRLQGIGGGADGSSGWLIRPSAGLMWEF